jgi:hypothetical protein
MVLGLSLIDSVPGVLGLLVSEDFEYFSRWVYFGSALIYTAFAFSGELSKEGPLIFSKRNARPLSVIFGTHLAFLAILLGLLRLVCYIDSSVPNWMTRDIGRGSTILDLLFIIAMMIMGYFERRWLYMESDTYASDPDNHPS